MPYNSYFPASYPQYYPQYTGQQFNTVAPVQSMAPTQASQGPQQMNNNIIWVQGEAGAKSYLVAPNTTVQLWDSERQTIYLKSADASGMPSIKTLDYTIREMPQQSAPTAPTFDSTAFATKDEVQALAEQISALRGDFDGLTKSQAGRSKKGVTENE